MTFALSNVICIHIPAVCYSLAHAYLVDASELSQMRTMHITKIWKSETLTFEKYHLNFFAVLRNQAKQVIVKIIVAIFLISEKVLNCHTIRF